MQKVKLREQTSEEHHKVGEVLIFRMEEVSQEGEDADSNMEKAIESWCDNACAVTEVELKGLTYKVKISHDPRKVAKDLWIEDINKMKH